MKGNSRLPNTSEYLLRRRRERKVFVKQRLTKFIEVDSQVKVNLFYEWRWYVDINSIIVQLIQEARDYLVYSPHTDAYTIWTAIYKQYKKHSPNTSS